MYETLIKLQRQLTEYANAILTHCKCDTVPLEFNNRLRSTAAQLWYEGRQCISIDLSVKLYQKYGLDRIKRALRHELAHVICIQKANDKSHGDLFKKVCQKLSGSIPAAIADANCPCSTNEYVREADRYVYVCLNCTTVHTRKRKIPNNAKVQCSCGNQCKNWIYTEIK